MLGRQGALDDADRARKHLICDISAGRIAHNRFPLSFDFLEEFLPPGGIGFVQTVDDRRHQIGKSLQVDIKLACNHIPAPVI
jgi:hypothetical protein